MRKADHKQPAAPSLHGPLSVLVCVILLCCFTFPFCCVIAPAGAESDDSRSEYKRIQRDLHLQRKKLESAKKMERSVLSDLRATTEELNDMEGRLAAQRKKIRKLQGDIASVQEEITLNKEHMQQQWNYLKKRLRTLQRMEKGNDAVLVLISGADIAKTLRMTRYLKDISSYDHGLIVNYSEAVKSLGAKQDRLNQLSGSLKAEEKKMAALEESLKEKKRERESLLVSVRKEKSTYQQMIRELQESSQKMLRIIQEAERLEREARKRKGKKQGTAEEEPEGESAFSRLKGKLRMPVSGTVALQYGSQMDPIFNLPVFRSGIHIKAPLGTTVRAVSEGKVVFADEFKGYGQLVIISHGGNYHTLYGNLSRIFSQKGAIINENDPVGTVGESGTLGASGLYFEIRYKGKPLDPHQWLRR